MSSIAAAMTSLRSYLAFIGLMALLGSDWSTWERVALGLALVLVVAINLGADGHRIWPRHFRTARYDKAA